MSQNQKQELISRKKIDTDIYIDITGKVYTAGPDKEVLSLILDLGGKNCSIMKELITKGELACFCG